MARSEQRRVVAGVGVAAGVVIGLYALSAFAFGQTPEWTSATSVCVQPESIVYEQGSSYSVFVREPSFSLSLTPGPSEAVVSRTEDGSYGVYTELNPSTDADAVTCRWDPDHVEIIEPNGIAHSIPASVFTGGR